jgi:hypothetical protein
MCPRLEGGKNLKLGVNVVRLTREFTGVGRYIECLLSEWATMEIPFTEVVLYAPRSLRNDLAVFPPGRYRIETIDSVLPDPLWERSHLGRAAAGCDVLFCPSYTMPIGFLGRCAVTYHGPALFPRMKNGKTVAEREGFEPSVELPLHTLSKRAPSTTRPSLRRNYERGTQNKKWAP